MKGKQWYNMFTDSSVHCVILESTCLPLLISVCYRNQFCVFEVTTKTSFYFQPGTEGDIDSDSDSSNSGIYEYVDNEGHEVRVSDSDSAPELPAPRQQSATKKKKKKDTKVEKGEKEKKGLRTKIKQFYKGNKGVDTDAAQKSAAQGSNTAPQSAGVLSKLKNLKKSKSSNSSPCLETMNNEDIPVCASSGTDTDVEVDPNSQRSSTFTIKRPRALASLATLGLLIVKTVTNIL